MTSLVLKQKTKDSESLITNTVLQECICDKKHRRKGGSKNRATPLFVMTSRSAASSQFRPRIGTFISAYSREFTKRHCFGGSLVKSIVSSLRQSARATCVAVAYVLAVALFCATNADAQSQICDRFGKTAIGGGAYIVQKNEWGSTQPQCVNVNSTGFVVSSSSITRNTNSDPNAPGGYPSIYQGCHFSTNSTDCSDPNASHLPLVVTNIASAISSWNTIHSQPPTDVYDAAYDIWFNSQPQVPTAAMPDGTELMIWLKKQGAINPAGNPPDATAPPTPLDNATWDVWFAPADPAHSRNWKIVSYVLKTSNTAAISDSAVTQLDILAFINDAIHRSYVDSSSYLISVEAGFEIWEGGTNLTTNSFSLTATPGPNPGLGGSGCIGLSSAPLNILWPTAGSILSGIQPFKARLENISLACYQMYWTVDGGQPNAMANNSAGGEHKEASVDLSGWTWRDAGNNFGPFSVNFVAQDSLGHTIQQQAVTIYVAKPTLSIWWPTDGSVLSGTQPFKARLENVALSSYQMYWSVDGGQLNLMSDAVDHKEASVDLSGWTWRDAGANYGPFAVTFTAKNSSGIVLQQKTINIYRAK
jgi:hypothetical protein